MLQVLLITLVLPVLLTEPRKWQIKKEVPRCSLGIVWITCARVVRV
jgi:hypothetical protein